MHWEGNLEEYLGLVVEHSRATWAFGQDLYDMILSHGVEDAYEQKDKVTRYKFFTDFAARHGDAIYS